MIASNDIKNGQIFVCRAVDATVVTFEYGYCANYEILWQVFDIDPSNNKIRTMHELVNPDNMDGRIEAFGITEKDLLTWLNKFNYVKAGHLMISP